MPAIPGQNMTLADLANTFGNGNDPIRILANYMSRQNPLTEDMVWKPTNRDTEYLFRVTNALPVVQFRSINEGVFPTRGSATIITETCSPLESTFIIDKMLMDISPDKQVYRLEQAQNHLEAMTQKFSEEVYYGNRSGDPRGLQGLSERYSNLTGPAAEQIIDAGGTTASGQASIWLVTHGERSFHGIYPKATRAGLEHVPGTRQDINDKVDLATGDISTYEGYLDRFKWQIGIALPDWRQIVRICNIDVASLATAGTASDTSPDLLLLMTRAANRLKSLTQGKIVIYMNRVVKEAWELQLLKKQNLALTFDSATGKIVTGFHGWPIKIDDTLLDTEEVVV
jgi:hypothetical protein